MLCLQVQAASQCYVYGKINEPIHNFSVLDEGVHFFNFEYLRGCRMTMGDASERLCFSFFYLWPASHHTSAGGCPEPRAAAAIACCDIACYSIARYTIARYPVARYAVAHPQPYSPVCHSPLPYSTLAGYTIARYPIAAGLQRASVQPSLAHSPAQHIAQPSAQPSLTYIAQPNLHSLA